jgi:hypothetical protein
LASVVYHYEWLNKTLTRKHPLRATLLFTDANLLNSLRALVDCKRADIGDELQATGVPGTINHLISIERAGREIKEVAREVLKNKEHMSEQSTRVIDVIGEKIEGLGQYVLSELDKRQIESHLTPHGMREVAQQVVSDVLQRNHLDKIGEKLDSLIQGLSAGTSPLEVSAPVQVDAAPRIENIADKTYVWGGKIRMLPEDFALPTENHSPALMWNLFIIGDRMKGIPPLRKVAAWNCPKAKGAYKRYCEFLQLMHVMQEEVVKQGSWTDDATAEAAATMFEIGRKAIELPSKSAKGYNVRPEQRAWTTVWKEIRLKGNKHKASRRGKKVRQVLSDSESDGEIEVDPDAVVVEILASSRARPIRKRARGENTAK